MELWIRSQDRTTLIKTDRLDIDYSSGLYSIKSDGFGTLLANYKSEKRALEVLDEIQLIKEIMRLQREIKELKKQYCERTDCSGRLGNSKKVEQLEKENQRLKEIEKEHQRINGCLHLEIKELKDRIDKIVEIIEKEIESLKDKKRMIMQILTPENGYLKTDVEYEIKRLERYLEILKGGKE